MSVVDMEGPEKEICAQIDNAARLIDERKAERAKLNERLMAIDEDIQMAERCINRLKRAQVSLRGDDETKLPTGMLMNEQNSGKMSPVSSGVDRYR
jgi:hypothetical protein